MFFQYLLAERIDLNLPFANHPGAFKTEIETAHTGEQRAECQDFSYCFLLSFFHSRTLNCFVSYRTLHDMSGTFVYNPMGHRTVLLS